MKPQLKGNWYKWLFVALRIFWCLKEKKEASCGEIVSLLLTKFTRPKTP